MHLVHGILRILQLQPTALLLPEIDFPNNQSSKSLKSDLMTKTTSLIKIPEQVTSYDHS